MDEDEQPSQGASSATGAALATFSGVAWNAITKAVNFVFVSPQQATRAPSTAPAQEEDEFDYEDRPHPLLSTPKRTTNVRRGRSRRVVGDDDDEEMQSNSETQQESDVQQDDEGSDSEEKSYSDDNSDDDDDSDPGDGQESPNPRSKRLQRGSRPQQGPRTPVHNKIVKSTRRSVRKRSSKRANRSPETTQGDQSSLSQDSAVVNSTVTQDQAVQAGTSHDSAAASNTTLQETQSPSSQTLATTSGATSQGASPQTGMAEVDAIMDTYQGIFATTPNIPQKRRAIDKLVTIPRRRSGGYGIDDKYLKQDSSEEDTITDEELEQNPRRPYAKKRKTKHATRGPYMGDPHHAKPYNGDMFIVPPPLTEAQKRRVIQRKQRALYRASQVQTKSNQQGVFEVPDETDSGGSDSDSDEYDSDAGSDTEYEATTPISPGRSFDPASASQNTSTRETAASSTSPVEATSSGTDKPSAWSQAPPPAPTPAHASLPSGGAPSTPTTNLNDGEALARARLAAEKYKPKTPSGLRAASRLASPSPSSSERRPLTDAEKAQTPTPAPMNIFTQQPTQPANGAGQSRPNYFLHPELMPPPDLTPTPSSDELYAMLAPPRPPFIVHRPDESSRPSNNVAPSSATAANASTLGSAPTPNASTLGNTPAASASTSGSAPASNSFTNSSPPAPYPFNLGSTSTADNTSFNSAPAANASTLGVAPVANSFRFGSPPVPNPVADVLIDPALKDYVPPAWQTAPRPADPPSSPWLSSDQMSKTGDAASPAAKTTTPSSFEANSGAGAATAPTIPTAQTTTPFSSTSNNAGAVANSTTPSAASLTSAGTTDGLDGNGDLIMTSEGFIRPVGDEVYEMTEYALEMVNNLPIPSLKVVWMGQQQWARELHGDNDYYSSRQYLRDLVQRCPPQYLATDWFKWPSRTAPADQASLIASRSPASSTNLTTATPVSQMNAQGAAADISQSDAGVPGFSSISGSTLDSPSSFTTKAASTTDTSQSQRALPAVPPRVPIASSSTTEVIGPAVGTIPSTASSDATTLTRPASSVAQPQAGMDGRTTESSDKGSALDATASTSESTN